MTRDEMIFKVRLRKQRIEGADELANIQMQISDCEAALGELEAGVDPKEVLEDVLNLDEEEL